VIDRRAESPAAAAKITRAESPAAAAKITRAELPAAAAKDRASILSPQLCQKPARSPERQSLRGGFGIDPPDFNNDRIAVSGVQDDAAKFGTESGN